MFQAGQVLDERYTIIEELGRGGMATVFKAAQPAVNRLVAIKVLPAHLAGDPSFYERFEREARVIAALEHPHILPVYDFGRHGSQAYLVMRYIEGGTLFEELSRGSLAQPRLAQLLTQIADALDHAHHRGVIHRDIKPSNILLDRTGNAYVGDFGIAKTLQQAGGLTGSGIIGTADYMSPEQAQGRAVDARSDVYSLGVMLFQMATGRVPFVTQRGDPLSVVYKHVTELPPAPRSLNPALLPELDGVILKALAKDPALRYPSAGALAQAVRGAYEADALHRATADIRAEAAAAPAPATLVGKLSSVALAGGLAGAAMFVVGLLLTLAGAFTRVNATGGATITVEDVGTPLVAAVVVGLAAVSLRLMRVFVPRSGCVFAALQAGFGLAAGVMAAFVGYGLFLLVTPSDTAGAGLVGAVGSLVVVFELFGFSVMGTAFGAGLAGPISRQRRLWQNGLAIAVPLAFGLAGTGFAAFASYEGSPNIYDFVRLLSFFMAEPVLLVFGLAAAEILWRYPLPGGAKVG